MSVMNNSQLQCNNRTCLAFLTVHVPNIYDCQFACISQIQCQAITFKQSTSSCKLFTHLEYKNIDMLTDGETITMMVMSGTRIPSRYEIHSGDRLHTLQLSYTSGNRAADGVTDQYSSRTMYTLIFRSTVCIVIEIRGRRIPLASSMIFYSVPKANWLMNGDAEMGLCESGNGITHPTSWNYNGEVTQMYYTNSYGPIYPNSSGPSDRGNCYFTGQLSSTTSMWQIVNLTNSIKPNIIDNQIIWFYFSAWIGGYYDQNDNVQVSLTFMNQNNQQVGNVTTLGPILASQRSNISSLLFQQASGIVPVSTRSFTATVIMTRTDGTFSDGSVDNIIVAL